MSAGLIICSNGSVVGTLRPGLFISILEHFPKVFRFTLSIAAISGKVCGMFVSLHGLYTAEATSVEGVLPLIRLPSISSSDDRFCLIYCHLW